MRILAANYVTRNEHSGSAGHLINWADSMRERGHEVDLLFGDDQIGIPFLDRHVAPPHAFWFFPIKVLAKYLKSREDYDLVQVSDVDGWVLFLLLKLTFSRVKRVVKIQGLLDRLLSVKVELANRGNGIVRARHRIWVMLFRTGPLKIIKYLADRTLVASKSDGQWLRDKHGFNVDSISLLSQGIHREYLSSDYPERNSQEILFVARAEPEKGFDELAGIFSREFENLKLTVAGCGVEKKELIEKYPQLANLKNRLTVIKSVKRKDLRGLYESSAMLVLPTLSDALPHVVLEAAACGCPVVTTKEFGSVDHFDDSSAILIDIDKMDELGSEITQLIDDPHRARHQALKARKVVEPMTFENMSAKFEKMLG